MRERSVSKLVKVRDFPYPYSAMLAICSDLDETPGHDEYVEISRFLNTLEQTRIGKGLGLEVGNTMYFDMAPGEYSFWNSTDEQREEILSLLRSGHIDAFHSYGDLADSRQHAEKALKTLESAGCRLRIWIDHAVAPTNFGADIMRGSGDVPGSDVYHADLTVNHGVKYVWRGRVTSVVGQGVRRRLGGIFDHRLKLRSAITLTKEFVKGVLGRMSGSRFRLHANNRVMEPIVLRDGQRVYEFLRSSPHPQGVSIADRGDRIFEVLREDMLDILVKRRGTAIVYTHLGKTAHLDTLFPPDSIASLKKLAERANAGQILVATTARTLAYHEMLATLDWSVTETEDRIVIDCATEADSVQGLSFVVSGAKPVDICVGGKSMVAQTELDSDDGLRVVGIPWEPLAWPL